MPETAPERINLTRWFTCLLIWWIVAVFFYLFISANENKAAERITTAGVATVHDSATKAAMPLLERDIQSLTQLAREVSTRKDVVNVSIIDHKNKIIAFTNPDQPLQASSPSVKLREDVSYWPHTLNDGSRTICFTGDISYAGTKIGEVFLSMSAGNTSQFGTVFLLTAMLSLLLIVFSLLVIDFKGIHPLKRAIYTKIRSWTGDNDILPDGREVVCPVCGSHKPLTRSFLLEANLDRHAVIRPTQKDNAAAQLLLAQGVNLRDISRREDLGWLRRQMVHRCADIIKKLAGE